MGISTRKGGGPQSRWGLALEKGGFRNLDGCVSQSTRAPCTKAKQLIFLGIQPKTSLRHNEGEAEVPQTAIELHSFMHSTKHAIQVRLISNTSRAASAPTSSALQRGARQRAATQDAIAKGNKRTQLRAFRFWQSMTSNTGNRQGTSSNLRRVVVSAQNLI